jgi:D-glycero-beta-D-manno-heptose 1-phosphate adenylyltransferase
MDIINKIVSWDHARKLCDEWRANEEIVVFTNGVFDLLHKGHIQYLEEASQLGDRLIIGLNSDESTMRLKGPGRPINRLDSRAFVLAAIGFVHAVVVFEEDTPYDLIGFISPDVLVKGGDYNPDEIVGADHVRTRGGKVAVLKYLEGYSTTSIEKKIRDSGEETR